LQIDPAHATSPASVPRRPVAVMAARRPDGRAVAAPRSAPHHCGRTPVRRRPSAVPAEPADAPRSRRGPVKCPKDPATESIPEDCRSHTSLERSALPIRRGAPEPVNRPERPSFQCAGGIGSSLPSMPVLNTSRRLTPVLGAGNALHRRTFIGCDCASLEHYPEFIDWEERNGWIDWDACVS
jgi:hypothetical protein